MSIGMCKADAAQVVGHFCEYIAEKRVRQVT
jgi:hypothetical protein